MPRTTSLLPAALVGVPSGALATAAAFACRPASGDHETLTVLVVGAAFIAALPVLIVCALLLRDDLRARDLPDPTVRGIVAALCVAAVAVPVVGVGAAATASLSVWPLAALAGPAMGIVTWGLGRAMAAASRRRGIALVGGVTAAAVSLLCLGSATGWSGLEQHVERAEQLAMLTEQVEQVRAWDGPIYIVDDGRPATYPVIGLDGMNADKAPLSTATLDGGQVTTVTRPTGTVHPCRTGPVEGRSSTVLACEKLTPTATLVLSQDTMMPPVPATGATHGVDPAPVQRLSARVQVVVAGQPDVELLLGASAEQPSKEQLTSLARDAVTKLVVMDPNRYTPTTLLRDLSRESAG